MVKRFVSFVVWWSPELYGAAAAVVAVVLLWPLKDTAGLFGLIGLTQVIWLSVAAVALLGRIVVCQLVWSAWIGMRIRRRVRTQRPAAEEVAA